MKHLIFHIIILCFCFALINTGCEKAEVHSTAAQADSTKPITNRGLDDCDDCPNNYCCCEIELVNTNFADLDLCNVYNAMPTTPCSPVDPGSPCSTISGGLVQISLNAMTNPRELFCLPVGGSFSITNTENFSINIRFTCQVEEINPDFESITIPASTTVYFVDIGDCFMMQC